MIYCIVLLLSPIIIAHSVLPSLSLSLSLSLAIVSLSFLSLYLSLGSVIILSLSLALLSLSLYSSLSLSLYPLLSLSLSPSLSPLLSLSLSLSLSLCLVSLSLSLSPLSLSLSLTYTISHTIPPILICQDILPYHVLLRSLMEILLVGQHYFNFAVIVPFHFVCFFGVPELLVFQEVVNVQTSDTTKAWPILLLTNISMLEISERCGSFPSLFLSLSIPCCKHIPALWSPVCVGTDVKQTTEASPPIACPAHWDYVVLLLKCPFKYPPPIYFSSS